MSDPGHPSVPSTDTDPTLAPLPAEPGGQPRQGTSVFFRDNAYRAGRELLTLAALLAGVVCVAAAFAWPWLPSTPPGGAILERYSPIRDGDARLALRRLGDDSPKGWITQNTRLIPGLRVSTDARQAVAEAFLENLREPGEGPLGDDEFQRRLAATTIIETRAYEVDAGGAVTESWQYIARDHRGDRLVAVSYPQTNQDVVLTPPVLMMPPALDVGSQWESSGKIGTVPYSWTGTILLVGRYDGGAGAFDDCLQLESHVVFGGGSAVQPEHTRDWYCAGLGWVEGHSLLPGGDLKHRTIWLGAGGSLLADAPAPPAPPALDDQTDLAPADRWRLTRLGRARATGETSESTIQPTWVPTDPPLLLAAGFGSDLVAFDTHLPGAPPRWRFHPDGVVYGQPAVDAARGRIYFGASDKRLYALDARGLFLWAFQTSDNVAARPLIVGDGDLVVVASEDGKVYGVEPATGRQRWVFEAEDSIVSWPVLVDGVVVVGSDDQHVYGLDPATGERRWKLALDGGVEAPIVADEGLVLVADRKGALTAFRPSECADECKPTWSATPGSLLRTAPLIADDRVIVVDGDGQLLAVSKEDGKRLWSLGGGGYVGAPALADGAIVVATAKGVVERISPDGQKLGQWDAHAATSPADGEPAFSYGPSVGGDALWIADTSAVIRRLGAPPLGEIPSLRLNWILQASRPPFAATPVRNTVVPYGGKAIVLDFTKNVYLVDPSTGAANRVTSLPGDLGLAQIEPILTGDTLLTISGSSMQALDMRSGALRWQGQATGTTVRPPDVAGQTVLWVSGGNGTGTLLALDVASGALRWQTVLPGVAQVGGVVAGRDAAFTSTPPAAWDLGTGRQLWAASVAGVALGGPALSDDGETVYVSGVNADGRTGMVVALDADSGAVRWQADLDDAVVNPLDRLWFADGLVVIPGLDGKVVALDGESGEERWHFDPPTPRLGGITVARGGVWFMLENARLYGLDLRSGRPIARLTELELALNGMGLTQRPVFVGDRLLFPAGLSLLGLSLLEPAP